MSSAVVEASSALALVGWRGSSMMEIRNTAAAASDRGGWSKYYLFSVPQNSKQMLNADSSQKSDEIKIEKQEAANMLDCLLSSRRIF